MNEWVKSMEQMEDPETGNRCLDSLNKKKGTKTTSEPLSLTFTFLLGRLLSHSTFRLAYIHTIHSLACQQESTLAPSPSCTLSPPFNASTPFVSLSYPDPVLISCFGRVESSIVLHHSNTLYYYHTYIIIIWPNQPVSSSSSPPFSHCCYNIPPNKRHPLVRSFVRSFVRFVVCLFVQIEDSESPLK